MLTIAIILAFYAGIITWIYEQRVNRLHDTIDELVSSLTPKVVDEPMPDELDGAMLDAILGIHPSTRPLENERPHLHLVKQPRFHDRLAEHDAEHYPVPHGWADDSAADDMFAGLTPPFNLQASQPPYHWGD